MNIEIMT